MPQPPLTTAANVDSELVKTIASLYASQADKAAEALYQQTSIGMSARERLKFSHIIEEEIRRVKRGNKSHVAQPNADWKAVEKHSNETLHTPTRNVFNRLWDSMVDGVATLLEGGVTLLYFAFWIALAIVVFHMACRIIGF